MNIRIGKKLTQAREALGMVVEDVAHRTKIPAASIRYLESEDFSHFPNNVYAKGFLRLYARHLGIDASPFITEHGGQLIAREDQVAYLDGLAVSEEFQNREEKAEAAAAAAAAANLQGGAVAPEPGKISSGLTTVLLLFVVGIPAAIFLSKLYESRDESQTAPAGESTLAPPPAATGDSGPGGAAADGEGESVEGLTGSPSDDRVPAGVADASAGPAPSPTLGDDPAVAEPDLESEPPRAIRIEAPSPNLPEDGGNGGTTANATTATALPL